MDSASGDLMTAEQQILANLDPAHRDAVAVALRELLAPYVRSLADGLRRGRAFGTRSDRLGHDGPALLASQRVAEWVLGRPLAFPQRHPERS